MEHGEENIFGGESGGVMDCGAAGMRFGRFGEAFAPLRRGGEICDHDVGGDGCRAYQKEVRDGGEKGSGNAEETVAK